MPKGVRGPDTQATNWDTAALVRFLEREWLGRGMDQNTFLVKANVAGSWISNLRADAARGPALGPLYKIRKAHGISVDLMVDILSGKVTVDAHGMIHR